MAGEDRVKKRPCGITGMNACLARSRSLDCPAEASVPVSLIRESRGNSRLILDAIQHLARAWAAVRLSLGQIWAPLIQGRVSHRRQLMATAETGTLAFAVLVAPGFSIFPSFSPFENRRA